MTSIIADRNTDAESPVIKANITVTGIETAILIFFLTRAALRANSSPAASTER